MISKKSRIFVTGHNGLVGSAVVRRLKYHGYNNIILIEKKKLDLRNQQKVFNFFANNKIDSVINAAELVVVFILMINFKRHFSTIILKF